jgi:hypothetical protein
MGDAVPAILAGTTGISRHGGNKMAQCRFGTNKEEPRKVITALDRKQSLGPILPKTRL